MNPRPLALALAALVLPPLAEASRPANVVPGSVVSRSAAAGDTKHLDRATGVTYSPARKRKEEPRPRAQPSSFWIAPVEHPPTASSTGLFGQPVVIHVPGGLFGLGSRPAPDPIDVEADESAADAVLAPSNVQDPACAELPEEGSLADFLIDIGPMGSSMEAMRELLCE